MKANTVLINPDQETLIVVLHIRLTLEHLTDSPSADDFSTAVDQESSSLK